MVEIPQEEIVSVDSLSVDGYNPNSMSEKEKEALKFSIEKYGFIIPIITNKDLLIADGEHRWTVAKEMGMKEVRIIRLPLKDVDRRILRQVLNKLRGTHDGILDALEMEKIVKSGAMGNLTKSLGISEQWVNDFLNAKKELPEQYFSMRMLDEEEQKKYESNEVVRLSLNLTLEQVELINAKIKQDEMYKKIFKMEEVFML
jgi:ParB-like chromosome segregation protein Spo0J